jgi:hypothetical protein
MNCLLRFPVLVFFLTGSLGDIELQMCKFFRQIVSLLRDLTMEIGTRKLFVDALLVFSTSDLYVRLL